MNQCDSLSMFLRCPRRACREEEHELRAGWDSAPPPVPNEEYLSKMSIWILSRSDHMWFFRLKNHKKEKLMDIIQKYVMSESYVLADEFGLYKL